MAGRYLQGHEVSKSDLEPCAPEPDVRFHRITQCIQEILNLARLFPDRIEGAWVPIRVCSTRISKLSLRSQVIPSGPADLCHCRSPAVSACTTRTSIRWPDQKQGFVVEVELKTELEYAGWWDLLVMETGCRARAQNNRPPLHLL